MSIRSHSQTSITFVTVYRFLGNRLHTGRCNVYDSYFKSLASIACLDFAFVAFASFCNVENADGVGGEVIHRSSGHHGTGTSAVGRPVLP